MIVLVLTNCPNALRGDLTRWLFEVDTNIYVGKQSARVREKIWTRVTETAIAGRAVMVFPAKNEQGFDFRVWGATWDPIDFDGLKLMLRPHATREHTNTPNSKTGLSKVEKRRAAKRFASTKKRTPTLPDTYLVVDVETTGLSPTANDIIEIGAVKVIKGMSTEVFQAFIRIEGTVPISIEELTGITTETILKNGRQLNEVMQEFLIFAGDLPIISHNILFDMDFLRSACKKCELTIPTNACVDTLRMARKLLDDPPNYKLGTLLKYFGIEQRDAHRSIGDCITTQILYEKLRRMGGNENTVDKVNENSKEP